MIFPSLQNGREDFTERGSRRPAAGRQQVQVCWKSQAGKINSDCYQSPEKVTAFCCKLMSLNAKWENLCVDIEPSRRARSYGFNARSERSNTAREGGERVISVDRNNQGRIFLHSAALPGIVTAYSKRGHRCHRPDKKYHRRLPKKIRESSWDTTWSGIFSPQMSERGI